jgi:hypothetical protein
MFTFVFVSTLIGDDVTELVEGSSGFSKPTIRGPFGI